MPLKMIILVGIPGSGKSTLAQQLSEFQRICQDEIGNRKDCENLAKRSLSQGKSVIIDRTNVSKEQRRYFLNIAKDFKAEIYCVFFNSSVIKCIERVKERKGHKTIPFGTPDSKIEEIVTKFATSLEIPDWTEGYEDIITISSFDDVPSVVKKFSKTEETD